MRGSPFALVALSFALFAASPAAASPVLFVGDDGTTTVRDDPYLPAGPELPPGEVGRAPTVPAAGLGATTAGKKKKKTVDSELKRFLKAGQITKADYDGYLASWKRGKRARRSLTGLRGNELGAVLSNLEWMAGDSRLEPTRLKPLFLTLDRNRELWATRSQLPTQTENRLEFEGSEIVWQWYPGQGIEIQPLGTFGKANGLWTAGDQDPRLARLFEEMIPLMAKRGSSLVWEYYFFFGGGRPPWASGMAQATGLQALSRAINRLNRPEWRTVIAPALKVFEINAPVGVRVDTPAGRHYLQYSFTPGTRIINAFMQSVLGLYETANQLNDPTARRLAELGDAQARVELPKYDTGAWTLYEMGGAEANLDYYKLARSFLKRLCDTVRATEYCNAFQTWTDYLRAPPETRLLTKTAVAKKRTNMRFRLDKVSTVSVLIADPGGRIVFSSGGMNLAHGTRAVLFTPSKPGVYGIKITATDLNENKSVNDTTFEVTPAKSSPGDR